MLQKIARNRIAAIRLRCASREFMARAIQAHSDGNHLHTEHLWKCAKSRAKHANQCHLIAELTLILS